jgi:L-rhamnonate dehydratase
MGKHSVKIKSVRAFAIRSDLVGSTIDRQGRRPAWTAEAEVAGPMSRYPRYKRLRATWRPTWPSVGCIVTATNGEWGLGMSRYGSPVITIINEHLGPLLADEPAMATERLWDMMIRMVAPYGPSGLAAYAISAVDLAIWDLKGKVLKRPVYELIGGPSRDAIPCYATGNDTDWHIELGFKGTKLACPHGTADGLEGLDRNEALVAKTRELVGAHMELMLDCWMSFDVDFAVRLAERLRPYGLRWVEDCLPADDFDGQSELRRRLPWHTLATGEHWYGIAPFAAAAGRRNVDVLQPDIGWVGGLTACVKICHIAESAGIAVVPHAGINTPYGQHLGLAMPPCTGGEYFLGTAPGILLAEVALTPGTATPADGFVTPSDAPGFGLGLTLDGVERMKP